MFDFKVQTIYQVVEEKQRLIISECEYVHYISVARHVYVC
jgi:hypothetical protein